MKENAKLQPSKLLLSSVGNALTALRKTKNVSQEELSKNVGLSRKYISDIENGRRNVSIQVLNDICKSLNIELHVFFQMVDILKG